MASESDRAFSKTPKRLKTDGISETDRASKRLKNCKRCLERISKLHNESLATGHIKLPDMLMEQSWLEALPGEFQIFAFKGSAYSAVYPPPHLIFNALDTTPFHSVKGVIFGQEPYPRAGQAMGLSFSVPEGVKVPSILGNVFKELKEDIGCSVPSHGNLEKWTLHVTVHDELILGCLICSIIDGTKHHILKAAHPSGLTVERGFFGCKHFSKTNQLLEQKGIGPIDRQL